MTKRKYDLPIRVLCVDDDSDFLEYVTFLAETYNIIVESCSTLQQAKERIAKEKYDAYILDLELPKGTGFDLIEPIKKRGDAPIAVITGVYCDEESFRKLKESYRVDYVLDKPIYSDRLQNLFLNLYREKRGGARGISKEKLDSLKENYDKTIPDKVAELSRLVKELQASPGRETLERLKQSAHKIGGSAGTYGYRNVTALCRELVHDIAGKLESQKPLEREWLDSLELFLRSIKYHFQFLSTFREECSPVSPPKTCFRHALYVVDSDLQFLSLLERKKEEFVIEVSGESDLAAALLQLESPDFNPKIVLLALKFPGTELTAYDIIEKVEKKKGYMPTEFGIIFDKEELAARVEAVKRGIKYTFQKPLSPQALLEALTEMLSTERLSTFRVLVLDDDSDVCNFIRDSLGNVGIEVNAINDPALLYPTLEKYRPHLLFLDVLLPNYDGLSLLKTLRSDLLYRDLGVVIVTHWRDKSVELKAIEDHADDIFYKPLDKEQLQKRAVDLGRQLLLSGRFSPAKKITGLPTYEVFLRELHAVLAKKDESKGSHLALFEIDRFNDLAMEIGRAEANDLLVSIGNTLSLKADYSMRPFFVEPQRFALLFENHDIATVEKEMGAILREITSMKKKLSFSCSIIPNIFTFGTIHELLTLAEQGIIEACKTGGSSPVKITTSRLQGSAEERKSVFIIDGDRELLKLVTMALNPYNIDVKTFTSGEEAINELFSTSEMGSRPLIISERKLSDMDGLDILKKSRERFRHSLPFFFLSVYSSDSDISEGLKLGASEYITKPFNLSLLVQKILKTIYK